MYIMLIMVCVIRLFATEEHPTSACGFKLNNNRENISLNSNLLGWVMLYNKKPWSIRLVNVKKPQFSYVLKPYELRSFNWQGEGEISCFQPPHAHAGDYPIYVITEPVNASDVININICNPNDPQQRYNDLHLAPDGIGGVGLKRIPVVP